MFIALTHSALLCCAISTWGNIRVKKRSFLAQDDISRIIAAQSDYQVRPACLADAALARFVPPLCLSQLRRNLRPRCSASGPRRQRMKLRRRTDASRSSCTPTSARGTPCTALPDALRAPGVLRRTRRRRCKAPGARDAFTRLDAARRAVLEEIQVQNRRKDGQAALERERARKQAQKTAEARTQISLEHPLRSASAVLCDAPPGPFPPWHPLWGRLHLPCARRLSRSVSTPPPAPADPA